ncbi:MAG TPA: DNA helicase RecQ [Candidatus Rokubacteria bacterium]|nr:DNA helicase RecQ [Candidatus Rokubacteria bacterium]
MATLARTWGYASFLPLQAEAVRAVLDGRDSVVVLPTGGGKSLCYQVPAVHLHRLAVVVSPLIALMKDQVDALRQAGVAAAYLNSSQRRDERAAVERDLLRARVTLLYVAPERLAAPGFAEALRRVDPAFFAVDEAHCISQWGHDFRPEYRQLRVLRETFPERAIHAYTATATPPVRADIVAELRLRDPELLVGPVDRPNLVYRVEPRVDRLRQVLAVIDRHRGQAGIVYCIRRAEVDELSRALVRRGLRAVPYHAGLADAERRVNQDAFVAERADIVVATVAFGMGIDRSNVRYVLHAGMPKSIEHYQQEAGRAGRDGLEAECVLLWSGADYGLWRSVLESEPATPPEAVRKLGQILGFCQDAGCRHRALVGYFGQEYTPPGCGACDVCLGEIAVADDSPAIARKILAGVAALRGRFGAGHVAEVLAGASTERIRALGHDRLAVHGTLGDVDRQQIRAWIDQLLGQGHLERSGGEYPTVGLTPSGARIVRGEAEAGPLSRPRRPAAVARGGPGGPGRRPRAPAASGAAPLGLAPRGPEDRDLFETLRAVRRALAEERGVPPYVIFSDASLRDMAGAQPLTPAALLEVKGVGEWKCREFGERFLAAIRAHVESPRRC